MASQPVYADKHLSTSSSRFHIIIITHSWEYTCTNSVHIIIEYSCHADVEDDNTVILGLTADELTALVSGIVVFILILVTLLLLLIVCLVMWRRRRAGGKGMHW